MTHSLLGGVELQQALDGIGELLVLDTELFQVASLQRRLASREGIAGILKSLVALIGTRG